MKKKSQIYRYIITKEEKMFGDKVILVAVILVIGQSFFTNAAPLEKTSIVKINPPPKVGDIRLKVI